MMHFKQNETVDLSKIKSEYAMAVKRVKTCTILKALTKGKMYMYNSFFPLLVGL